MQDKKLPQEVARLFAWTAAAIAGLWAMLMALQIIILFMFPLALGVQSQFGFMLVALPVAAGLWRIDQYSPYAQSFEKHWRDFVKQGTWLADLPWRLTIALGALLACGVGLLIIKPWLGNFVWQYFIAGPLLGLVLWGLSASLVQDLPFWGRLNPQLYRSPVFAQTWHAYAAGAAALIAPMWLLISLRILLGGDLSMHAALAVALVTLLGLASGRCLWWYGQYAWQPVTGSFVLHLSLRSMFIFSGLTFVSMKLPLASVLISVYLAGVWIGLLGGVPQARESKY